MAFAGHGLKEVTIRIIPGRFDPLSVVGREDTFCDEGPPYRNAVRAIDAEYVDSDLADVRLAGEKWPGPFEVIGPVIFARMEERNMSSGQVTGRQRALVRITAFATQGEVFRNRWTM